MSDNLLAPLVFEDVDIDIFVRDYRCAYGCTLVKWPTASRRWQAVCQTHGPIMAHNFVKAGVTEHNEQGRMWAERDLRPENKQTPEQILHDLGY